MLHHFDSSTRHVVKLGLIVCSDTDSETQQLWPSFGKGKYFFSLSLCRAKVHCFTLTASTWLHKSKHVKNEKTWKKKVKGRGNELDDVIHFIVTKKILSAGKNKTKKTLHFFPLRCQNDEQQRQKQRWQKEEGNQSQQRQPQSLCFRTITGLAGHQVSKKTVLDVRFITWEMSFQSVKRNTQSHLAAYVEVSLSQIQCGNLTAQTVHF